MKTIKILIFTIITTSSCEVSVLDSEEKIVITHNKDFGKIITSKIHYFKDGKCEYNITYIPDTTQLDLTKAVFKVWGGKIVMKNRKYIITPNCNSDSLILRTYYYMDSSEILLEEINLKEVRGY